MMDKRKRSLLKGAKDEIELDKMNKQKQGKVNAAAASKGRERELQSSLQAVFAFCAAYAK